VGTAVGGTAVGAVVGGTDVGAVTGGADVAGAVVGAAVGVAAGAQPARTSATRNSIVMKCLIFIFPTPFLDFLVYDYIYE